MHVYEFNIVGRWSKTIEWGLYSENTLITHLCKVLLQTHEEILLIVIAFK